MSNTHTLTLTPIKILFERDCFAIYATKEGSVVKGETLESPKNLLDAPLVFSGVYENHQKYGTSFSFVSYERQEGELFTFLTTIIKGVSKKLALLLIEKFGDNLPYVIENEPQKLLHIAGIKEKKLAAIVEGWEHFSHLKHIANFLAPHGITNSMINRIYAAWGENAIDILRSSPYKLTQIHGIGFKKADEIARKLGVVVDDPKRIEAGVIYSIDKLMTSVGHTLVKLNDVISPSIDALEAEETQWKPTNDDIVSTVTSLYHHGELVIYGDFVILKKFDMMEKTLLSIFKSVNSLQLTFTQDEIIKDHIKMCEEKLGIVYAQNQVEAITMATSGVKCSIIAGYAGAGKSTVAKAILSYFGAFCGHQEMMGCALSGVAANRIKQTSGYDAVTIHSLLGYNVGGFTYHKNNPLPYKVILLDESSMVDTEMFYRLILAIDFDITTLIMLGDPAQLPPVGPGGVFGTLLNSNILPSVILDKIYRQSDDQAIVAFANEVRQGNVPEGLTHKGYSDLFFIQRPLDKEVKYTQESINHLILDAIIQMGTKVYTQLDCFDPLSWEYLTYFQVISPMREGVLGVRNLNAMLQPLLNPPHEHKPSLEISGKTFRKNDKIIHLSNKNMQVIPSALWEGIKDEGEYSFVSRRVYNGQIGVLFHIDEGSNEIIVFYPNDGYYVFYSIRDFMDTLADHAFAMTIHKSQGSEFDNVVLPITASHSMMLSTKLLYTAMTRAKTKLVITGEVYPFVRGVQKSEKKERNTLMQWLCSNEQKGDL